MSHHLITQQFNEILSLKISEFLALLADAT